MSSRVAEVDGRAVEAAAVEAEWDVTECLAVSHGATVDAGAFEGASILDVAASAVAYDGCGDAVVSLADPMALPHDSDARLYLDDADSESAVNQTADFLHQQADLFFVYQ